MMRINLKVHLDGTLKKTKKPLHFCKGLLLLAPSLGLEPRTL